MLTRDGRTLSMDDLPTAVAAELREAAAMDDNDIDTRDADAAEVADWSGAVRGRFYRPATARRVLDIDVDVLAFYEAEGAGYQTRINRALRASMLRTLRRRAPG